MAKVTKTRSDELSSDLTGEETPKTTNKLQVALGWADDNVLPFVSIIALLSLAVKGAITYLPQMNYTAQVVVAIVAVALLGVKAFANRK